MENNELLQAILNKLDGLEKGQELLQQEVAGLSAGQESLKQAQSMTDIKLEKGQKYLQAQITKTNIILENSVDQKLSALFDGHQLNTEKIDHISETVDNISVTVTAATIMAKTNEAEIEKLKERIG